MLLAGECILTDKTQFGCELQNVLAENRLSVLKTMPNRAPDLCGSVSRTAKEDQRALAHG